MKVYVYKEYFDDSSEERLKVFATRTDARAFLKRSVKEEFDIAFEDLAAEYPSEDNTVTEDYVSIKNHAGLYFFEVEEHELVGAEACTAPYQEKYKPLSNTDRSAIAKKASAFAASGWIQSDDVQIMADKFNCHISPEIYSKIAVEANKAFAEWAASSDYVMGMMNAFVDDFLLEYIDEHLECVFNFFEEG